MHKKIILFDIDYTLFDTTKFKELITDALASLVPHIDFSIVDEIYYEVRKQGSFNPQLFATLFKEKFQTTIPVEDIQQLWWDKNTIQQALYPEVVSTLETLTEKGDVVLGVFSSGNVTFQREKIASISHFFTEEHMYFADQKDTILSAVFDTYKDEDVCLIDDFITFLQKAKSVKKDLSTIWMKRGKFALQAEMPDDFTPDATVTSLTEIVSLLDNNAI